MPDHGSNLEYFLAIDGVEGGSTDRSHHNEIVIRSFLWGVTAPVTAGQGGGGAVGRPHFEDLSILAPSSLASPRLLLEAASGRHHALVTLTGRRAGGEQPTDVLTIGLTGVVVTSFRQHGDGDALVDEFTLSYGSIRETWVAPSASGAPAAPVVGRWDVVRQHPA